MVLGLPGVTNEHVHLGRTVKLGIHLDDDLTGRRIDARFIDTRA